MSKRHVVKVPMAMRIDSEVKATVVRIANAARMTQVEVVERAVRHAEQCWRRGIVVELERDYRKR